MCTILPRVALTVLSALLLQAAPLTPLPRVVVGPTRRHLVTRDGRPFLFLADTAYELLNQLTAGETEHYLRTRARQGFTVVMTVAIRSWRRGTIDANRAGEQPLIERDPARPNEAYFRHVDEVLDRAAAHGLYVALVPIWGGEVTSDYRNGRVDGIFTPGNTEAYGRFLGQRYRDRTNVIWVLGGDRAASTEEARTIWRAMARGIALGVSGTEDYRRVLMTYHPVGPDGVLGPGFSSDDFPDDPWLDFHLIQTGHRQRDVPNHEYIARDYARTPLKPTLDGESRYEDHWINSQAENGRFDGYDQRQAAYWSLLAGACGHTYGNNNVWQMWTPERKPAAGAHIHWREALLQEGARGMTHLRSLFESRPWQQLVPDQSVLEGDAGTGGDEIRAARATNGSFLFVYTPTGRAVALAVGKVAGARVVAWWFDPRTGRARRIGVQPANERQRFTPPSQGRGQDWVLVVDSGERRWPPPGRARPVRSQN